MSCSGSNGECFQGRGICQNLTCYCTAEYLQKTDLNLFSECSANKSLNFAAYITFLIFYIILLILDFAAIWLASRRPYLVSPSDAQELAVRNENKALQIILFISLCYIAMGSLILTGNFGDKFVGTDVATTILFSLATSGSWLIMLFKPLYDVNWTYVSVSSALIRIPVFMRAYSLLVFPLFIVSVSTTFATVGIYYECKTCIQVFYLGAFSVYLVHNAVLLASSFMFWLKAFKAMKLRSGGEQQIKQTNQLIFRTKIQLCVTTVLYGAVTGTVLAFGVNDELARRYSWIVLPVLLIIMCTVLGKTVVESIRQSVHSMSDTMKSSDREGSEQERMRRELGLVPTVQQPPMKKKSSRYRRKKTKPMKIMSHLSERTNEGGSAGGSRLGLASRVSAFRSSLKRPSSTIINGEAKNYKVEF